MRSLYNPYEYGNTRMGPDASHATAHSPVHSIHSALFNTVRLNTVQAHYRSDTQSVGYTTNSVHHQSSALHNSVHRTEHHITNPAPTGIDRNTMVRPITERARPSRHPNHSRVVQNPQSTQDARKEPKMLRVSHETLEAPKTLESPTTLRRRDRPVRPGR